MDLPRHPPELSIDWSGFVWKAVGGFAAIWWMKTVAADFDENGGPTTYAHLFALAGFIGILCAIKRWRMPRFLAYVLAALQVAATVIYARNSILYPWNDLLLIDLSLMLFCTAPGVLALLLREPPLRPPVTSTG